MPQCCRCNEDKPADEFPYAEKLEACGPWCLSCWAAYRELSGPEWAEANKEWKRDYMRAYMRFRRKREGLENWREHYQVIGERERYDLHAHGGFKSAAVRLSGRGEFLGAAREMLEGVFGVDPVDIEEHGVGGGRGTRRQPKMMVKGTMSKEAWLAGMLILRERCRVL